jgi:hypothetical protein
MSITQGSVAKLMSDALKDVWQQLEDGTYPVPTIEDLIKYPIHTRVREVRFLESNNLLACNEITEYKKSLDIEGMENRF